MAAVAIAAVLVVAARFEANPIAGAAIIGACILCLTFRQRRDALVQRQARGLTTSRKQKAFLILSSMSLAVAIIGVSDLAFLTGYYGFMRIINLHLWSHWTPYRDPGYMAIGAAIGLIVALRVASILRRKVSSCERSQEGHSNESVKLWPVGLVALVGTLLVAEKLYERYSYCRWMADSHARPEAWGHDLNEAALHAWLNRWYERAAIRPWLPIHPDSVPRIFDKSRASEATGK
jgi:hypothetical protein